MKKYPSIEQFRSVVRTVRTNHDYQGKDEEGNATYQHLSNYPTLKFKGTVKIHGTNAGIVKYKDRVEFQSRERVLTLEQDNANFMLSMLNFNLDFLFERFPYKESVAIYGEWCGGNIQKGVAINGLPKMFVIFGIKVDDEWIKLPKDLYDNAQNIYNILQFPTYEVDIDFNSPELAQNEMIEMTLSVEDECPVGKYFGNIGVGEGIVFTCIDNQNLKFKSKGEKHSVSKVKVLNSINTEELESIQAFVEATCTDNRLEQGINYLKEMNISLEPKNTGEFLRWVVSDILKEEMDTIISNQLDVKKTKSAIVNSARIYFLNNF